MLKRHTPEVGTWYENLEGGQLFEVVAVDDETGFVAAQYFDGALEELDRETFLKLPLRMAEQPEDWTGPFEMDERLDLDMDTTPFEPWQTFEEYDDENLNLSDPI